MTRPPIALRLRIQRPGKSAMRLWAPVLVAWPLAVAASLAAAAAAPVASCLRRDGSAETLCRVAAHLWEFGCSARGLRVEVTSDTRRVFVSLD